MVVLEKIKKGINMTKVKLDTIEKVKEFVNDIKNNAAPDKTIVTAETIEPQGPKFTVVDEPKTVQPDFSKNKTTKKTNNKTSK